MNPLTILRHVAQGSARARERAVLTALDTAAHHEGGYVDRLTALCDAHTAQHHAEAAADGWFPRLALGPHFHTEHARVLEYTRARLDALTPHEQEKQTR